MPRLTEWFATFAPDTEHLLPEERPVVLMGTVYGHPLQPDGTNIRVSRAVARTPGGDLVTVSGSRYILEEPHPDYADKYPDARTRLLDSLPLQSATPG
jgi:hypothetical protein